MKFYLCIFMGMVCNLLCIGQKHFVGTHTNGKNVEIVFKEEFVFVL